MLDAPISRLRSPAAGRKPDQPATAELAELPGIPAAYVDGLNAFFRRRPSLQLKLAGRGIRIAATWLAEEPEILDACTVTVKADGDQAELVVPQAILQLLIEHLDPSLSMERLDPEQIALLLEFALSDALGVIEQHAGAQLSIVTVTKGAGKWTGPDRPGIPLVLYLERLGVAWAMLRLSSGDCVRLAHVLDRLAGPAREPVDLPLPFRVRVAAVTLSLAELRSVRPGDVLLADDMVRQPDGGVAVIGEHLVAPVEITPAGFRFGARIRRGRGSSWEWSLDAQAVPPVRQGDGGIESLPVRVMFERGALTLGVGEIQKLTPGAMLSLANPLSDQLDIVVNGQRIGRGELTRIGDSNGVRVRQMFGKG